jgi:hypothetical protein
LVGCALHTNIRIKWCALHTLPGESDIVQHDAAIVGTVEYKSDALKPGRLWQRVHKAMVKLKVPPAIIEHVMKKRDVQILAKNLHDWQGMNKKK